MLQHDLTTESLPRLASSGLSTRIIVHLAASPFFGGPERQMLGLARTLPERYQSIFLSFAERGLAMPFLKQLRSHGLVATALKHNAPHFLAAVHEVAEHLRHLRADVLCCHGYKPDLLGFLAAARAGVPVVSVSRGWTAVTPRVRVYEAADRRVLRWMSAVVCVSEGQAAKVKNAGVRPERVLVIRNAIEPDRFDHPEPTYRQHLRDFFPHPRTRIVCAAGRLSPEKGFEILVDAAALVAEVDPSIGFVLFGEGPERPMLERRIAGKKLQGRFILAGFRTDVDRFLPHADAVVIPSYTEGLPNIALEAAAARVPVVATAVGGVPEVVLDGQSGYLVPPADPAAMAGRIVDLLEFEEQRTTMGLRGRRHVEEQFTFQAQSQQYQDLFDRLIALRWH